MWTLGTWYKNGFVKCINKLPSVNEGNGSFSNHNFVNYVDYVIVEV